MKEKGMNHPKAIQAFEAMQGLPARRLALKVIRQVTEDGAYASLSLDAALKGSGLNNTDRRLVSRLVYDTLDNLILLDWYLNQVMARPDTDLKLRNILRLGACQVLLENRIPDSAAVNLCVRLCEEVGMPGLKGVCNGILRNLIRKRNEILIPDPKTDPVKAAALQYSIPEWLVEMLKDDYGTETDNILSFRNPDEGWMVRPNLIRMDAAAFEQLLAKKVWKKEKTVLPHGWRIFGAMDISLDADYRAGNFSIQSGGSQIVSRYIITAKKLQMNPSQMILRAFLKPYTSVKTSPSMYVTGNSTTAAGSVMSAVTAHILPAVILDSRRHVT